MTKRYAAIDIGTNTILMMIADINVSERKITILSEYHSIARLGENVDKTNKIGIDAIQRSCQILENYKNICRENQVSEILVVGTSALRDSENASEVKQQFENILKAEISIIKGEEEARISFIGTVENNEPSCVLDIGGGSTEVITGKGNDIFFRKSMQIGAVRLTERFFSSNPPASSEIELARTFIKNEFSGIGVELANFKLFSVAGTPTTLAAVILNLKIYDSEKVNGFELKLIDLEKIFGLMQNMTSEEIEKKLNIHPKRADVILAGNLILIEFLKFAKKDKCTVSAYGLRYGLLKSVLLD